MNDNIERLRLAAEDTAGGPPSAEQVDALVALVDALDAALEARQPTEDDREALIEVIGSVAYQAYEHGRIADAILAAGFPRAAVPDAATEALERVRAVLAEERAWHEHLIESGDAVPRTVVGIGKVEAALDGAPEQEVGRRIVIGKQDQSNEDECWTFTEWKPSELEEARKLFPNGAYEVVTVFGLPVESEEK